MMKYTSNSILIYLGEVSTKTKLMCKAFASSKKLREKIDLFDEFGLAEYVIDNDMIEYQMKVDDQKLSQNTTEYPIGIQGNRADPVNEEIYFKELKRRNYKRKSAMTN